MTSRRSSTIRVAVALVVAAATGDPFITAAALTYLLLTLANRWEATHG